MNEWESLHSSHFKSHVLFCYLLLSICGAQQYTILVDLLWTVTSCVHPSIEMASTTGHVTSDEVSPMMCIVGTLLPLFCLLFLFLLTPTCPDSLSCLMTSKTLLPILYWWPRVYPLPMYFIVGCIESEFCKITPMFSPLWIISHVDIIVTSALWYIIHYSTCVMRIGLWKRTAIGLILCSTLHLTIFSSKWSPFSSILCKLSLKLFLMQSIL